MLVSLKHFKPIIFIFQNQVVK